MRRTAISMSSRRRIPYRAQLLARLLPAARSQRARARARITARWEKKTRPTPSRKASVLPKGTRYLSRVSHIGRELLHDSPGDGLLNTPCPPSLKACVFYLYTGKTNFLPLTSEGALQRELALLTTSESAAPACSPKSMFRLAESVRTSLWP